MQVSYRFCVVDPGTWRDVRVLGDVEEANITYDLALDTRATMTMRVGEDVGECYIRAYIILDGAARCLGTFLAQTQSRAGEGRREHGGANVGHWDVDAYAPLLELADDMPDIGFSLSGGTVRGRAAEYASLHMRAPVASDGAGSALTQPLVAKADDTWLSFISALLEKDGYRLMVEPDGTVSFAPARRAEAMQPVHAFADGDVSVVMPDITDTRDLYGVPNIVEVVASTDAGAIAATAVNDDPGSPVSTVRRGRPVRYRDTSPSLPDGFDAEDVQDYADRLLAEKSSVTRTIEFEHGWIEGLAIGDCIRLDLDRYGIHTLAIVQAQEMECTPRATVKCTATYMEVV